MIKKLLTLILFLYVTAVFSQQTYYNSIDFSKSGVALKNDLATLIINTHTNFLDYTPDIWEACKITDANPSNSSQVILLYGYTSSGITARTRGKNENGGANGDWNREHTYPRSLGNPNLGSTGPGSDAHHLRPTDVQYNAQRGNKKYASGSGNSGDVSGGWYPGDEWKGDVARMMMYMYLRYGNQCLPSVVGVGSNSSTPDDMIDLFLKWNAEDPVSEIEDTRNTYHGNGGNFYAQGNRNPFIDNPYLATKIWGNPPSGTQQPEDRWGTLSTNEFSLTAVNIYPNPTTNDEMFIAIPNDISVDQIAVYSLIGKKVFETSQTNGKVRLQLNQKGIYLLRIKAQNQTLTRKLIFR